MAATKPVSSSDSVMDEDKSTTDQKLHEALLTLDRIVNLTDLLICGPKAKYYGWVMELNEALKRAVTTPVNLTFSFRPGSRGYHSAQSNALHQLLTLLRDALVHMRYAEATEILKSIVSGCRVRAPLALETAIHRSGLEVMYSVPDLPQPPLTEFIHQLKQINSSYNPQKLVVEQFIHTLTTSCLDEAIECISSLPKASTKVLASEQGQHTALLYRAYKGLTHYLEWERLRNTLECQGSGSQISTQYFNQTQLCKQLAERALEEFSTITNKPGVWDMFVCSQIQLLEYLKSDATALAVLESYRKCNEDNPNSHRYLLDFHRRHGHDTEDYKTLLTEYCKKWPSDKFWCLHLAEQLDVSSDAECRLLLSTLFALLDYSCYKEDFNLWKKFKIFLNTVKVTNKSSRSVIHTEWKERESWWKAYHFTKRTQGRETELFKLKHSIYTYLTESFTAAEVVCIE